MKRSAAGHRTHLEDLQPGALAINVGVRLIPVHLRFHTPVIALRNEYFVAAETQLPPLLVNIATYGPLASREAWQFRAQPLPNPASRVALLHRCMPVFCQYPVNECGRIH
jgi:hypothetical protein